MDPKYSSEYSCYKIIKQLKLFIKKMRREAQKSCNSWLRRQISLGIIFYQFQLIPLLNILTLITSNNDWRFSNCILLVSLLALKIVSTTLFFVTFIHFYSLTLLTPFFSSLSHVFLFPIRLTPFSLSLSTSQFIHLF